MVLSPGLCTGPLPVGLLMGNRLLPGWPRASPCFIGEGGGSWSLMAECWDRSITTRRLTGKSPRCGVGEATRAWNMGRVETQAQGEGLSLELTAGESWYLCQNSRFRLRYPANFKPMFSMRARLVITQDLTEEGAGAKPRSRELSAPTSHEGSWLKWVSLHSRF